MEEKKWKMPSKIIWLTFDKKYENTENFAKINMEWNWEWPFVHTQWLTEIDCHIKKGDILFLTFEMVKRIDERKNVRLSKYFKKNQISAINSLYLTCAIFQPYWENPNIVLRGNKIAQSGKKL